MNTQISTLVVWVNESREESTATDFPTTDHPTPKVFVIIEDAGVREVIPQGNVDVCVIDHDSWTSCVHRGLADKKDDPNDWAHYPRCRKHSKAEFQQYIRDVIITNDLKSRYESRLRHVPAAATSDSEHIPARSDPKE